MSVSDISIANQYVTLLSFEAAHWNRLKKQGVKSIDSWHDPVTMRTDLFAVKMDDGSTVVFPNAAKCLAYLKVLAAMA